MTQFLFQNLETPICFLSAHAHRDSSRHQVCTRGAQRQPAGASQGRVLCAGTWAPVGCRSLPQGHPGLLRVHKGSGNVLGQHCVATTCTDTLCTQIPTLALPGQVKQSACTKPSPTHTAREEAFQDPGLSETSPYLGTQARN